MPGPICTHGALRPLCGRCYMDERRERACRSCGWLVRRGPGGVVKDRCGHCGVAREVAAT